MKVSRAASALLLTTIFAIAASAQTPATARSQVSGTVVSVDAGAKKLAVKSDKGEELAVTLTDKTRVLGMPPGETDTKKATPVALDTLSAGDRALVIGPTPTDPKVWTATTVLVLSKSGLASLQQKDQDDWKKRGSTGTVTAVDAKTATIKVGQRTLTVQPSEKTAVLRYSLDSARFADAKPSTFAEIKIGDQMRVLGNKTEDGATILAEKILSGTFRQLAATITSINAATGELVVKDLATKKPLTIKLVSDSTMRKLSEQMAAMLARRYNPAAQAGGGAPSGRGGGGDAAGRGGPPAGGGGGMGRGMGGPGGGGGRGGDVNTMLDSLPAMPLTELKPGDAIMVSTTLGSDPTRVTAIMLLAGVEPLLTSPTAARDIMGSWNLGGGGDSGGQ